MTLVHGKTTTLVISEHEDGFTAGMIAAGSKDETDLTYVIVRGLLQWVQQNPSTAYEIGLNDIELKKKEKRKNQLSKHIKKENVIHLNQFGETD